MEISVLIPLYNGIETLEECVKSVKDQVYTHWTATVGVNGHGPDGGAVFQTAKKIVESLQDSRFRVINIPDVKGAPTAINHMVASATTDWIAHIDADDKWDPYKLLYQVEVVKKHPNVGVVGTFAQYFGEYDGAPDQPAEFVDISVFHTKNPMIHSSILIRKEYAHYTDEFYGIYDYDCWVRNVLKGVQFYNVPFRLTHHRLCASISVFNSSKKQQPELVRLKYFGHT
jgi:glycosyltransferase involved in cell wall biosynthesis